MNISVHNPTKCGKVQGILIQSATVFMVHNKVLIRNPMKSLEFYLSNLLKSTHTHFVTSSLIWEHQIPESSADNLYHSTWSFHLVKLPFPSDSPYLQLISASHTLVHIHHSVSFKTCLLVLSYFAMSFHLGSFSEFCGWHILWFPCFVIWSYTFLFSSFNHEQINPVIFSIVLLESNTLILWITLVYYPTMWQWKHA